jgi:hypothetical protein
MDTPLNSSSAPGSTSANETSAKSGNCTNCGQPLRGAGISAGIEQFLGHLGITEDMIDNLKTSFSNVDVEEYVDTAREYLLEEGGKVKSYARENPGKIAVGVAVLALGTGLLISALNRD